MTVDDYTNAVNTGVLTITDGGIIVPGTTQISPPSLQKKKKKKKKKSKKSRTDMPPAYLPAKIEADGDQTAVQKMLTHAQTSLVQFDRLLDDHQRELSTELSPASIGSVGFNDPDKLTTLVAMGVDSAVSRINFVISKLETGSVMKRKNLKELDDIVNALRGIQNFENAIKQEIDKDTKITPFWKKIKNRTRKNNNQKIEEVVAQFKRLSDMFFLYERAKMDYVLQRADFPSSLFSIYQEEGSTTSSKAVVGTIYNLVSSYGETPLFKKGKDDDHICHNKYKTDVKSQVDALAKKVAIAWLNKKPLKRKP
jgi:hypothetical protein